jgi:hypothetical protein
MRLDRHRWSKPSICARILATLLNFGCMRWLCRVAGAPLKLLTICIIILHRKNGANPTASSPMQICCI